ncbi:MAG: carboxymuconolactone decarboxylase family protein [Lentisphaeria bacterium]|nr:carboxymuconolactone decarboxylase family protein [Lentisphaeria bacterium]
MNRYFACCATAAAFFVAGAAHGEKIMKEALLTDKEIAAVDLGAAVARGDRKNLAGALNRGFDAGLTLAEAKEYIGQLYAYCGFPRALNAAVTLQDVVKTRQTAKQPVPEGKAPSAPPKGNALDFGTANQTKLCGAPVKGGLFDFHPQLDEYLKAHLFGDIFARDNVDWRTREILTVAALAARPETAPQMKAHLGIAKVNGVSDAQGAAIVKRVQCPPEPELLPADWSTFPVGAPNTAYAKYFIGRSFLAPVSTAQVGVFAVTFEPGCRNNWHIHHAAKGGGQILICTAGEGYYQEWGKPAVRMRPGDTVNIAAGVKHWHGAAPDSWFQHLAVEVPGEGNRNEWLEPVDDAAYARAVK